MSTSSVLSDALACREVVELVTTYLERALSSGDLERIDGHLDDCPDCAVYVEQLVTTMRLLRVLGRSQLPASG